MNFILKLNLILKEKKITNNIINDRKIVLYLNSLNTIRKFRNRIAHNLKVYNYKVNDNIKISTKHFNNPFIDILTNNIKYDGDLYSCIIAIALLLDNIYLVCYFFNDLKEILTNKSKKQDNLFDLYISMYNLPVNILSILENASKYYQNYIKYNLLKPLTKN